MKIIVISDIHGSLYYMRKIEEVIEKEKPFRIILLGDLYYHGPRNPLPLDYNPMEVAKILNKYHNRIKAIQGNCDAEVDQMISDFKIQKSYRMKYLNKRFFFTHGHKHHKDNIPTNIDYLIYGHLHTHFVEEVNGVVCINAGSISMPKNKTKHSYILIEDNKLLIKDIDRTVIEQREI